MNGAEALASLDPDTKLELLQLLEEQRRRERRNRLVNYSPYPKQVEFHNAGAQHRERLFMAGNQLGKTLAGGAEMAMHLTGKYPDWWDGRRFNEPILAMCGSESTELTRDGAQKQLIGPPDDEKEWGTGFIPGDDIVSWSRRLGVADAIDTVTVKHVSGGKSTLLFKSYDQKRRKWQANTAHVVWFDEEPPLEIYMEGLTRTNATDGLVYLTFTPLLGMSEVVMMFFEENREKQREAELAAGSGALLN